MREINPSASVVIASGFIDPAVRSELQALGVLEFIQKPYRPDTMLLTIRHVLDARRP
jgi:DNA-binding NarL/FixJ family response regulator